MTSVARRPAPYTSPVLVAPPTGVEATDAENIQKAYEGLGKAGTLQLRAGTYQLEPGVVNFNKYPVWLRGQGGIGYYPELGPTPTAAAGTRLLCSSKTGVALKVEEEGVELTDFLLANNYSSERAHLTTTLSTAAGITSFKCSALTEAIPTETAVRLLEGSHEQFFRTTAEAAAGAEEVKVESLKPNFAFPLTTTKVIVETPTAGAGLEVLAGSANRGGHLLRCDKVNFENFFINVKHANGFTPVYSNCQFVAGVEYNFKHTNAVQPLGGDITIIGCTFFAVKKRKLKAHYRVESASGYKILGCKFNSEAIANPEVALDFNNQTTTPIGIGQIVGNSIEGWKTCIRITGIAKGEVSNFTVVGNEMVSVGSAKTTCLEITHSEVSKVGGIVVVGNSINTEKGTVAKISNSLKVRIGNNNYQPGEAIYKAEATNTGLQIGVASEPTVLPAVVEEALFFTPATEDPLGGVAGSRDCLVQLTIEPKAGEALEGEIGVKVGTGEEQVPIKFKFLKSAEVQTQTFTFLVPGQNLLLTGVSASPGKWKIVFGVGKPAAMRSVYTYLN